MPFQPAGFIDLFLAQVAASSDRIFARFEGEPVTFGDLGRMSAAFAGALAARGLGPGTRVAVMMANSPQTLGVLFGIARAGAIWIPVNARQRGEGLRYILEHSEPQVIVADEDLLPVVEASGAKVDAWILRAGGEGSLAAVLSGPAGAAGPAKAPDPAIDPATPFAIMYTSGTTGRPKGVLVTHLMLRLAGESVAQLSLAGPDDVFFVWEPLYHIGGAQTLVLPLIRGARLAMVGRFSASRFWDQVRAEGATRIHYLGGILQLLLKQPPRPDDRSHPVSIAWGGGCPAEIWRPFEERFGVQVRECYGMTEASSLTTCNETGIVGSVGRPLPWFTVDLLDESGAPVPQGEKGEIVVRTRLPGAIFPGYFRNPEATAAALRDGALHTGDSGSFDAEGNLFFHGRLSDSVRCRGENVSAWEVEHVAASHPAVEDCAIIGVPAEIGEQDIKLFVKPKPGAAIDPASFLAWLAERLAPYQTPRYLALVAEFERTPSERIMKHKLPRDTAGAFDRERR